MTKIIIASDCGNSPKREFLKKLNIAFAKGDMAFLDAYVTDSIRWEIIGNKTLEGKEAFLKELDTMKVSIASELVLDKILTHGKEGAVNGTLKMQDGKKYAFSDFYEFSSGRDAKVKSIISYVIKI
ncbi:Ketosteroid isomerase-related protein [Flagellimonas taeanensis]|uniref:Ketosteroid isomerase-related protein n=1 Tax=Flagellimonas taeanensis TaxID=1005926 RepID=A0A1M6TXU8_9FLAO|nr:nuclear transport factor 2 family protein [Allomuricauda taeanensis]SFB91255.1 Ketosteroid isomerase-related protein [Allomuricauda taeanensis]SHK61865.1 Ketosteroid isomerase-related protein [Allomuricauda taeanensis]